jgi:hypothetical protein
LLCCPKERPPTALCSSELPLLSKVTVVPHPQGHASPRLHLAYAAYSKEMRNVFSAAGSRATLEDLREPEGCQVTHSVIPSLPSINVWRLAKAQVVCCSPHTCSSELGTSIPTAWSSIPTTWSHETLFCSQCSTVLLPATVGTLAPSDCRLPSPTTRINLSLSLSLFLLGIEPRPQAC